ncbi:hypothetical protein EJ04DRAFT_509109 [Polyplosphaeria fusca]|uniref:Uncharacterized protein n=1 Tax=Polyplosphaeria fusca TaxID=682080 RepID=A0A9P4R4F8_9PLEO|nr:hypothetical protein EJ04DRAFT_509109 [Polyplosphaeria fusca]
MEHVWYCCSCGDGPCGDGPIHGQVCPTCDHKSCASCTREDVECHTEIADLSPSSYPINSLPQLFVRNSQPLSAPDAPTPHGNDVEWLRCHTCSERFTGEYSRGNLARHTRSKHERANGQHHLSDHEAQTYLQRARRFRLNRTFRLLIYGAGAASTAFAGIDAGSDLIARSGLDCLGMGISHKNLARLFVLSGFVSWTTLLYRESPDDAFQDRLLAFGVMSGIAMGAAMGMSMVEIVFGVLPWTVLGALLGSVVVHAVMRSNDSGEDGGESGCEEAREEGGEKC